MRNYIPVFILFFVACHEPPVKKIAFDFYAPALDSNNRELVYSTNQCADFFNLRPLNKGVDSFEIRLRPWDVFGLGIELYVFKFDSTGWKGYHYNSYTLFHERKNGSHISKTDMYHIGDSVFMVKEIIPLCGWKNFEDSLQLFKLEQLPTQSQIVNFRLVTGFTDGSGCDIEIASSHSYRLISYFLPEFSPYAECKTVTAFNQFIKRQLGENYDWPDNLPSDPNKKPRYYQGR